MKISPLKKRRKELCQTNIYRYSLRATSQAMGIDVSTYTRAEVSGAKSPQLASALADYFDLHESEIMFPNRYMKNDNPALILRDGTVFSIRDLFDFVRQYEKTGKPTQL